MYISFFFSFQIKMGKETIGILHKTRKRHLTDKGLGVPLLERRFTQVRSSIEDASILDFNV